MEKVFARVRSYLEISVAVARTSQSPFPLYATGFEIPHQINFGLYTKNWYF